MHPRPRQSWWVNWDRVDEVYSGYGPISGYHVAVNLSDRCNPCYKKTANRYTTSRKVPSCEVLQLKYQIPPGRVFDVYIKVRAYFHHPTGGSRNRTHFGDWSDTIVKSCFGRPR